MNEKLHILGIGKKPVQHKKGKYYVTIANVHGIVFRQTDRELKRIP